MLDEIEIVLPDELGDALSGGVAEAAIDEISEERRGFTREREEGSGGEKAEDLYLKAMEIFNLLKKFFGKFHFDTVI